MALPDGPLRRLSLDGLPMNGLPMNGLLLKALTMKNHRLVIAALCLTPLLAACELVVDFDRTRIVPPGDSGADMSASDMNPPPTDMPVADMPGADLNVADMDIPDMPGADLNVADLGVTDLGTDDLGVADLGVADLGVADLGQDLGPMDAGPPACPTTCNDSNPCTDDSCVVATGLCAHVPNTDTCDDSNACTTGDVCAATVCAGTVVDCSAMNGDCVVGMCNTTTGACVMMERPNGTACMTTMMCMSGACVP